MTADGIDDREERRSMAWRIFFDASTRVQGVLEGRLRRGAGLSLTDYSLMLMLYERDEYQMRMGELADVLAIPPSRLTYQISRLVKEGLVEKRTSAEDGRVYVAKLTPQGVERIELAAEIHRNVVRESLLDEIPDEHIDRIVEAFEQVDDQRQLGAQS